MATNRWGIPDDYELPLDTPTLYGPDGTSPAAEQIMPEPPDSSLHRVLSDAYRNARRALSAVCAIALAWATAQFDVKDLKIEGVLTIELGVVSIPLLLGAALIYLIFRWGLEYAMMPRHTRRWRLAQFDFRLTYLLARASLVLVAGAAMDRSFGAALRLTGATLAFALCAIVLWVLVSMLASTTRITFRRWRRPTSWKYDGVDKEDPWINFVVPVVFVGAMTTAIWASTSHARFRDWAWAGNPPHPLAQTIFCIVFLSVLLSPIWQRELIARLFSEPPAWKVILDERGRFHFVLDGRPPKQEQML